MKIIFMGTPEFALPTLQKLINSNHEVVAVFSQTPKPKGRGLEVIESPVHKLAIKNNIKLYTPLTLKSDESLSLIENIEADIIVVVAYGFLIPKKILESKKYGCINLHPSDLPKFRGAAPLQHTILSGDKSSSICVIQMDEGLDTGPILAKKDFTLPERPSLRWLHDFCSEEGGNLVLFTLNNYEQIQPIKQADTEVIYAHKLSKSDSYICWNQDAFQIDNKIRAYSAWPGSYTKSNIGDIKIIDAEPILKDHQFSPGFLFIENGLNIACKSNLLKINTLQLPGKKPISYQEFLNGYGTKLEFYTV